MMTQPRLSASSYSNTAPLIWSFLYGRFHGTAELLLDNAPARSAELLAGGRVDAALTPVVAFQTIPNVLLVPDVCVGTRKDVRSVCLVTRGMGLDEAKSVALDTSSRTSAVLAKILFREFLGFEPKWVDAGPDAAKMLEIADCALLIGDPALRLWAGSEFRTFDLAGLWHEFTGLGFVFAMWMTAASELSIDLAAARDEGLRHLEEIAANYSGEIGLSGLELRDYLTENIAYGVDEKMQAGMDLFFELALRNGLIERKRATRYCSLKKP
jgi:chorismate dehydratase